MRALTLAGLQQRIESKAATIAVIGLGYVGLAVACSFAKAGFRVLGIERRAERVAQINAGISPIQGVEPGLSELLSYVTSEQRLTASSDPQSLHNADLVLVAVETPVDSETKLPSYTALTAAIESLGRALSPGTLVIIESTIAPGTIAGIVRPLLERSSGLRADEEFFLGHCPERVMPGRLLHNLAAMSRVCGGGTPETSRVMASLYRQIVDADLDLADCATAEMVKTAENAYRDVQIAFANELALICEQVGADVWQVRELVNKSPGRNVHLPGAGVGGHCIPKDPWLLVHAARQSGSTPQLIPAARAVNDAMPQHMAKLVAEALDEAGCPLDDATIAVLGYAYLENSDDTRNTPSESLVAQLRAGGAHVRVHDPYVDEFQGELHRLVAGADALVIMVGHDAYRTLDLAALRSLMRSPILVDGRRVFEPDAARQAGFAFCGLGRGDGRQ